DIRHNFVANVVYELPFGRGTHFGGWQISAVASAHSNSPFTPMLAFDNADVQSLVISQRPYLVGNPYTGACPNGARLGTPSCWFNPTAIASPRAGQSGTDRRRHERGRAFAQVHLALQKTFKLTEGTTITSGAEAYNLLNHQNVAVPSNTQSPLALGGTREAVFKDTTP